MKLSKYVYYCYLFNDGEASESDIIILYSTLTGSTIILNNLSFNHLLSNEFHLITEGLTTKLIQMMVILPIETDETDLLVQRNDSSRRYSLLDLECSGDIYFVLKSATSTNRSFISRQNLALFLSKYLKANPTLFVSENFLITWTPNNLSNDLSVILDVSEFLKIYGIQNNMIFDSVINFVNDAPDFEVFTKLFNNCGISAFRIYLNTADSSIENQNNSVEKLISILKDYQFIPQDGIVFEIHINITLLDPDKTFALLQRFVDIKAQNRITFQFSAMMERDTNLQKFAVEEIDYMYFLLENGFYLSILPEVRFSPLQLEESSFFSMSLNQRPYLANAVKSSGFLSLNPLLKPNEVPFVYYMPKSQRRWFQDPIFKNLPCSSCSLLPVCGGWSFASHEQTVLCPPFVENIEDRLALYYVNNKMRMNEFLIES